MTSIEYKVRKNTLKLRYINDLEYVIYLFTPINFKIKELIKEIGEIDLLIKNFEFKDSDLNNFTYILTENDQLFISKHCIDKKIGKLGLFHNENLSKNTFIPVKFGENFKVKKVIYPWFILTNNGRVYNLCNIYKYINLGYDCSMPEVNIIPFGKKIKDIYTFNHNLLGLLDDNKIYELEFVEDSLKVNLEKKKFLDNINLRDLNNCLNRNSIN